MSKLYCCGITCGAEIDKIKDLVNRVKDYVDGFIWTVDHKPFVDFITSKDNQSDKASQQCWDLIQFLKENKKDGKIVHYSWKNAHDWSANEWLHCGTLKEGDWVWMFDSSESPTDAWLKSIRDNIKDLDANGFGGVYCSGRPYLFKYSEYLFFHGTPHWGLYGHSYERCNTIPESDKSKFIINKRDLNPSKHYQEHDTKYYLYGRSNIIDAFYGKYGQTVVNYHEKRRREFREYLKLITGLEPSLKALDEYFKNREETQWTTTDQEFMELEFCLSEYYQRTVLKMDFMTTMHPRERWSFKNYLLTGDGWSDKNYLGMRLIYEKNATQ